MKHLVGWLKRLASSCPNEWGHQWLSSDWGSVKTCLRCGKVTRKTSHYDGEVYWEIVRDSFPANTQQ